MPRESNDIYRRVDMFAVSPWEIVVDRQARRWQDCRYIGHKYYLPLSDAKAMFGNKQFDAVRKHEFFEKNYLNDDDPNIGIEMFKFIEIVEFYDLINEEMIFWTSN